MLKIVCMTFLSAGPFMKLSLKDCDESPRLVYAVVVVVVNNIVIVDYTILYQHPNVNPVT